MISLSCVISICLLVYNELLILWDPEFSKTTTVSTDPNKHSHIITNLEIEFPNMPCYLFDVFMTTSINKMDDSEIQKALNFIHVDSTGAEVHKFTNENIALS